VYFVVGVFVRFRAPLQMEVDPYKNFVYTSFQELATYVSHNRVSQLAKSYGDASKM
jgi:hypothetical protein